MRTRSLLLLLALPYSLAATELSPWFGNLFQPEARVGYEFDYYPSVQSPDPLLHHSNTLHVGSLSLSFSPDPALSLEAELLCMVATRHPAFHYDSFRLTGRYLWLDDVSG